jgi:hypothetical protein
MRGKTLQILIAIAVFFVLQIVFFGVGEGRLFTAIATSLIFGLIYAAIIAGVAIFRGRDRN